MDLKKEKRSDSYNIITSKSSPSASASASASKQLKCCSDCNTTRTPLWRGGPAGPKSLCNACGIKYNKKRRELLGVDKGKKKKKKKMKSGVTGGQSVKMRKWMALGGGEIMLMLRRSGKLLGKLREEEQAAILLMALSCSCGSVYYAAN